MEYAAGEGRAWRASLQEWLERSLDASVFNPTVASEEHFRTRHPGVHFRTLKETDPDTYRAIAAELVALDCREIAERTDFLICYWDESAMRGAGTKGELTMAKYFQKPVFLVTSMAQRDIPGWVLGCTSRLFPTFDELRAFLTSGE